MHKFFLIVLLVFSVGCAKKTTAPATPAAPSPGASLKQVDPEIRRLEQSLKKGEKAKTSADTVSVDDPTLTPREKKIKLGAREIELREELKKIEEAKRASRSPAEKKAEKEISRQEKFEVDRRRSELQILIDANVEGCPEGGVTIEKRVTGSYSYQSHVKIRVTNLHSSSVNIEDESGPVVRNLCTGGSITMFRARNMWLDGNILQFHYTAKGTFPDGSMGLQESQQFSLSAYDVSSGRVQQYFTWNVSLQKVYRAQ
jgi:hypothetical protein